MLIAAFKADRSLHDHARRLLSDPNRDFLATSLIELELTQPQFNPIHASEAAFYLHYLRNVVSERLDVSESLISRGLDIVRRTQAGAMDALHLASASVLEADEFITAEAKGKPLYRETNIPVTYLGDIG